ncbi:MAG TPA: carbohydrate ABC transporter permease, partial [Spirochaetia bacterium]|nr:carbohydrate ABC transporter permease [Spirochaetia bacterium]
MARALPAAVAARTLVYLLLVAFGVLMVMPFYWMIVSSLHTPQNLVAYPPKWWPRPAVLTHYASALSKAPFLL